MSDGRIVVDYSTIDQAGADCGATVGKLRDEQQTLQGVLAPLINDWEGDGQARWQELQNKWNNSYAQLEEFLEKMSKKLPEVADELRQGDQSVANLF
ncbi:WXG100 family type VII secretion target [Amycolatopsis sp. NPDC051903]|uniref:WXG100 family type VII secretion target n=1 Tax=Amycolatopsis sp. NPDC051903 TaxID=3363936 RepID=UPI0037880411